MTSSDAFGIYVHWPFCKAKCPYCDFNSHVRHEPVDALSFARALGTELAWFAERTPGRTVTSIFFGGGTPSLMPPEAVGHVLDSIGALWSVSPDVETTLEANPTSIEAENFRGYRAAGVNRVSVGVQALNDEDLKALGRQHSSEEALAAFRLAARIFPRVSFDMIYARPNQTPGALARRTLPRAGEQQGHMSLYQLTIEPGTAYFDLHERGKLVTPADDCAADLYDLTQELTEKAGLSTYEVSNHAAAGPGVAPQSALLALWRICGRGPRRAQQAGGGREPPRADRREASGDLARAGARPRPRHRLRHGRAAGRPGQRISADGHAHRGRHRHGPLCRAGGPRDRFIQARGHEVHGPHQARRASG